MGSSFVLGYEVLPPCCPGCCLDLTIRIHQMVEYRNKHFLHGHCVVFEEKSERGFESSDKDKGV